MAIVIKTGAREVTVPLSDRPVLEIARDAGVHIAASCGGGGTCGKCTVFLEAGAYRIFGEDVVVNEGERREELACVTFVTGPDARIAVPREAATDAAGARIETEIRLPPFRLQPVAHARGAGRALGLAVDIGTTTVAAALVDLKSGSVLDRESRFNQQVLRGDDVASRIGQCDRAENVRALQQLVIAHTINPMAAELCERNACAAADLAAVAVAGNTVMSHLFLGLSPFSIGRLPFTPVTRNYAEVAAAELGLHARPDAPVYVVPSASGYVGGDIVADLHVTGLPARAGAVLLVDIGTNGEMALVEDGRLLACATAAGPAFEGGGLAHGCRAVAGAVEHVDFDAKLDFRCAVIGGVPPVGICGSAAIDFVACGVASGLINLMGRFDLDALKTSGRHERVRVRNGWSHACVVVPGNDTATGEPLLITEHDIAQIMKAKAAIYAGLKTLSHLRGRHPRDLDRVILAGGFAKHLRLANAIAIGLLPDVPLDRFEIAGNGSLAGAVLALLDTTARDAYARLIDAPEIVELNLTRDFATFFSDALALPYLEPDEFSARV